MLPSSTPILAPAAAAGDAEILPESDPLTLPAAWTRPARPPLPIVASTVPIIGAVVLYLVTGSMFSLLFAALGPVIAVATVVDGARGARRDRRRADVEAGAARERVSAEVGRRHDAERGRRWARHPDVQAFSARNDEVWRSVPGRGEALVIGAGEVTSAVRITGGEGSPDAAALRTRAARLTGAPVVVPATDGVAITGPAVVAAAVQRALAMQLCLALPPGELRIVGSLPAERAWAELLPHRRAASGLRLALVGPGETLPSEADVVIVREVAGAPHPPRCAVSIAVGSLARARVDYAGAVSEVDVEGLAYDQAASLAEQLSLRAERSLGLSSRPDVPIALADLLAAAPAARSGTLPAVIGREGAAPAIVDLVTDGPHAVVAGVTGSGKSELLITWILALCATHSTREVTFLLADFKGGTAFDALAAVPHVTGVITDLDGEGARRAIESLRAEVRLRESAIAGAGARDILDPRVDLPRLVVVVDEFAALLGDHPELHAVFSDVAARGRALGIHLVLGTQRAAGVIRDSLLANCPLRISLRVTDASDSRAVIGTDEAAKLPGDASGRGLALLRRGGDGSPRPVRIALSHSADVDAVVASTDGPPPRRPWLPALPNRISLDELRGGTVEHGVLVLGLADEPQHQRQRPIGVRIEDRGLLVVGGPGAGKSTALAVVAAQAPAAVVRIPATAEAAWDAVADLVEHPPAPGTVLVIDDLDTIPARLPHDHAHEVMERLERLMRSAGESGILVVASTQRLAGATARLADLLPRRVVLPMPSRADHFAAGGDPEHFAPDAPPGRGRLDGVSIQLAHVPRPVVTATSAAPWWPLAGLTGFASRRSPAARAALAGWAERGVRVSTLDEYAADPSVSAAGQLVLTGEPDDWQRHWRVLAEVRADHDLVVDASCGAELRLLTGSRTIAPYCEPGRGRAWLVSAGAEAVRILLPGSDAAAAHRTEAP